MPSPRFVALAAVFIASTAWVHAAPGLGAIVSLTERESATVAPGAILTYDSVADSRCPPDVHCVMAGKVAYSFTLKQGDTLEHFTLSPAASLPMASSLRRWNVYLYSAASWTASDRRHDGICGSKSGVTG